MEEDKDGKATDENISQHDDELEDTAPELIIQNDDDEDLEPLPIGRSKSTKVGSALKSSLHNKKIAPLQRHPSSAADPKKDLAVRANARDSSSQDQQSGWLEVRRLWAQWRRAKMAADDSAQGARADGAGAPTSPLIQVLAFARNTEIGGDPTKLR